MCAVWWKKRSFSRQTEHGSLKPAVVIWREIKCRQKLSVHAVRLFSVGDAKPSAHDLKTENKLCPVGIKTEDLL